MNTPEGFEYLPNVSVSVLMAIYIKDSLQFLDECMLSLSQQRHSPVEVIVVADGPVAVEQIEIINNYSEQLDIKFLRLNNNVGLAGALNAGLNLCTGEYIARMDSDDICLPDRFLLQADFLQKNKNVDILGSSILEFNEKGMMRLIEFPLEHKELFSLFSKRDPVAHPSVMFRSTFIKKIGGYNPSYKKDQDTELWYRSFKSGAKFANLQVPLLKFRMSTETLGRRSSLERLKKYFTLRVEISRELQYDFRSIIYAFCYCIIQILPVSIKKLSYRFLR